MNLLDLISKGLEERKRTEALEALQQLATTLSGEPAAADATGQTGARAAMPLSKAQAPVLVEPDGSVRDAGGWFQAPGQTAKTAAPSWVNDSENLFRSDVAALGLPRLGGSRTASGATTGQAAPAFVPPASAASGRVQPKATAPAATPASAVSGARRPFGVNERLRAMALAKQAGLDPLVLDQALTLAGGGLDPYAEANLAFGKTASGPWRATPYGNINAATGQAASTPYADANVAYKQAQAASQLAPYTGGSYGSTNRFTGAQVPSDLTVAQTGKNLAQIGQAESASVKNIAQAGKARRVQLADGTLVEAVEQPDGRLTVRPITDTAGAPVRGQQPSAARQFARGPSPEQTFVQRFNARAAETGNTQRAEQQALADMAILFPGWQPGQAAIQDDGSQQAATQQTTTAAEPVRAELAAIDAELREAIQARPDLADRFRAQALRATQELLGGNRAQP